jgi:UDP-N-acetylmuramoylalanine--D-glutamate ligase
LDHSWLRIARACHCVCLGELDFASLFWKGKVVAITGTNGKSTLTEFLCFAFNLQGGKAFAVGNNGYPMSRLFNQNSENAVAFCEVSSFQSQRLSHFRPDALLWTNFTEDHLDIHANMRNYFAAKWNLVKRLRGNCCIIGDSVGIAAKNYGFKLPEFVQFVSTGNSQREKWKVPFDSCFASFPQRENLRLAQCYWNSEALEQSVFSRAVSLFKPLKHRLSKVTEVNGVQFWNDSKATNFSAVLAALDHFKRPVLWIGGGRSKGGNLEQFTEQLIKRVKAAFLIGEAGYRLFEIMRHSRFPCFTFETLQDAVLAAFKACEAQDTILLSPGFASQDMFKNYVERGMCFENTVLNLKKLAG